MSEERERVRRMLAGEERAFDLFFDDVFPRLYRFALARLGGDEDAAEEVAQAALCRALPKLHTWRGEAALFTWLCTFCRHEISGWLERNGRRGHKVELREDLPEVRAALDLAATSGDDPERALERVELGRLVRAVLDHLPASYGRALTWKYLEDASVSEIADRLRITPKAAESVLSRARSAFRDAFAAVSRAEALGRGQGERA